MVIAAVAGPSVLLSSRLESDVRRSFRAHDASARVIAGPLGVLQGRLARLDLRARGAMLDGTSVDEIALQLRSVTIDPVRALRGELVLRSVENGAVTVVVGEESLRRYLVSRDLRNPAVRMDRGMLTVTGQVT
ncbi:MAG TPA: LmeA family phospholipid-binding protein, partial [bacterium]